ncbi:hypothetical protein BR93DRAFT_967319 [Coniochaeta sp. PMI_546]|nr:hypothetical protein BR93DRAFT_967319 [Coniochaeta sp. PMI_546]
MARPGKRASKRCRRKQIPLVLTPAGMSPSGPSSAATSPAGKAPTSQGKNSEPGDPGSSSSTLGPNPAGTVLPLQTGSVARHVPPVTPSRPSQPQYQGFQFQGFQHRNLPPYPGLHQQYRPPQYHGDTQQHAPVQFSGYTPQPGHTGQFWHTPHPSYGVFNPCQPGGATTYTGVPRVPNVVGSPTPYRSSYIAYTLPGGGVRAPDLSPQHQFAPGAPPSGLVHPGLSDNQQQKPGNVAPGAQQSQTTQRRFNQDITTPTKTGARTGTDGMPGVRRFVMGGSTPGKKNWPFAAGPSSQPNDERAGSRDHIQQNPRTGGGDMPEAPRTVQPVQVPRTPTLGHNACGRPTGPPEQAEARTNADHLPNESSDTPVPDRARSESPQTFDALDFFQGIALLLCAVKMAAEEDDDKAEATKKDADDEAPAAPANAPRTTTPKKAPQYEDAPHGDADDNGLESCTVPKSTAKDGVALSGRKTSPIRNEKEEQGVEDPVIVPSLGDGTPVASSGGLTEVQLAVRRAQQARAHAAAIERARKAGAPVVEASSGGLTEAQLAARRAQQARAHAAAIERARKAGAPVVEGFQTGSNGGVFGWSTTALCSAANSTSPHDTGRGQAVSHRADGQVETGQSAIQPSGGVPKDLRHHVGSPLGGSGQGEKTKQSDRENDVRVAMPALSLLGLPSRGSTLGKQSTKQPESQTQTTREAIQSEVAISKAEGKKAEVETSKPGQVALKLPSSSPREDSETYGADLTAMPRGSRTIFPPPGFKGLKPVTIESTPPQSPTPTAPTPLTSADFCRIYNIPPSQAETLLQLLRSCTSPPNPEKAHLPQTTQPHSQKTHQLPNQEETTESKMDPGAGNMGSPQQLPYFYLTASGHLQPYWPDSQNFSFQGFPMHSQMPHPANAGGSQAFGYQTPGPAGAGSQYAGYQTQPTMHARYDASTNTWIPHWTGLASHSGNIGAEALPSDWMKKYYPNGPPPNMARHNPIPDNGQWASSPYQSTYPANQSTYLANQSTYPANQSTYPANQSTAMTTATITPEEQARHHARTYWGPTRYWGMTAEEAFQDVKLRDKFAWYLVSLGLSREDYDREYSRYADVFDSTYVADEFRHLTVEHVKKMPLHELTEPMITMAFRNLLIHHAEPALPKADDSWRDFIDPTYNPPVYRPKPNPFGAIGDERKAMAEAKAKGKEKEMEDAEKTWVATDEETKMGVKEMKTDDEEGKSSTAQAAEKGVAKGVKKGWERQWGPGYV